LVFALKNPKLKNFPNFFLQSFCIIKVKNHGFFFEKTKMAAQFKMAFFKCLFSKIMFAMLIRAYFKNPNGFGKEI
jgi:hypothetical protein